MTDRVLLVDDEPQVLSGYKRNLRKEFDLSTAEGPEAALAVVEGDGPFAVVVSDLQMPGMDGITLLSRIEDIAPDSIRIMLTGQADLDVAVAAVNDGHVFRFLTKPCPADRLGAALRAGLDQYRLVMAERELLEDTLQGTVEVLVEVIGLANSRAQKEAEGVRARVEAMVAAGGLHTSWEVGIAATLCTLGTITLPDETRAKLAADEELPAAEQSAFDRHPEAAFNLLSRIPRLEGVAAIIRDHLSQPADAQIDPDTPEEVVALGSLMLGIGDAYEHRLRAGRTRDGIVRELRDLFPGATAGKLLDALAAEDGAIVTWTEKSVGLAELRSGMRLEQDVSSLSGTLLVKHGETVNRALLERLRAFAEGVGIEEPLDVSVPQVVD